MIYVIDGTVGVALHTGETAQCSGINKMGGYLYTGPGLTVATLKDKAGTSIVQWATSITITQEGGNLTTEGTGTITAMNQSVGATAMLNSTGTITALNYYGTVDFTKSQAPRTVTTPKYGIGGTILFDPSVLTRTNEIAPIATAGNVSLQAA
jgi:hypothetical protein